MRKRNQTRCINTAQKSSTKRRSPIFVHWNLTCFELTNEIKCHTSTHHLPVIIVIAYSDGREVKVGLLVDLNIYGLGVLQESEDIFHIDVDEDNESR